LYIMSQERNTDKLPNTHTLILKNTTETFFNNENLRLFKEFTDPILKNVNPAIANTWHGLTQDQNIINTIGGHPAMQELLQKVIESDQPQTKDVRKYLEDSIRSSDDLDDNDDTNAGVDLTSSSPSLIPARDPEISLCAPLSRTPEIEDDSDDDLGISRKTHVGDDYVSDDEIEEMASSSDEEDVKQRTPFKRRSYFKAESIKSRDSDQCPVCGSQSGSKPIPMNKNYRRKRSTSGSSFGAGSPPQYCEDSRTNRPVAFTKLSIGFVSLAILWIVLHSMGHKVSAKSLLKSTLPWLVKHANNCCPGL